jgi:energy-converting hydrogenase Eha subunit A
MGTQRTTWARALAVVGVLVALIGVLVAVVVALPVLSSGPHHAAGASAEAEVAVPVNALGGLGVTGVLGVALLLGLRNRHRRRGDP